MAVVPTLAMYQKLLKNFLNLKMPWSHTIFIRIPGESAQASAFFKRPLGDSNVQPRLTSTVDPYAQIRTKANKKF